MTNKLDKKKEFKMPIDLGAPELLIILFIIILLFGAGRIGKISGELGRGIRSFKEGLQLQNVEVEHKTKDYLDKSQ